MFGFSWLTPLSSDKAGDRARSADQNTYKLKGVIDHSKRLTKTISTIGAVELARHASVYTVSFGITSRTPVRPPDRPSARPPDRPKVRFETQI